MSKRYIFTGTPGSGKTTLLNKLAKLNHQIIREAATDIIKQEQELGTQEPWMNPTFIDKIVTLQRLRQEEAMSDIGLFDRSPICTYALSIYLGYPPSSPLLSEIERIKGQDIYENKVFFIENLGYCKPSDARKISFEEALKFEQIHPDAYNHFGYTLIQIPALSVEKRVYLIEKELKQ